MCPYPSSRLLPPSSVAHLLPDGRRPWRPLSSPPVLLPIVRHRRTRACRDPRRRASAPAAAAADPATRASASRSYRSTKSDLAAAESELAAPNPSLPRRIGLTDPSLLGPGSLSLALHRILETWDVAAGDSTPELVRPGPPLARRRRQAQTRAGGRGADLSLRGQPLSLSLSSGARWWSQVNLLPTGGPASYGGLEARARL
jgi:hypothetical protein